MFPERPGKRRHPSKIISKQVRIRHILIGSLLPSKACRSEMGGGSGISRPERSRPRAHLSYDGNIEVAQCEKETRAYKKTLQRKRGQQGEKKGGEIPVTGRVMLTTDVPAICWTVVS